jgi:hypothetical protein
MTLATSKVFHIPSSECDHAIAYHNLLILMLNQAEIVFRNNIHVEANSLLHNSIKETLQMVKEIKFDNPFDSPSKHIES